MPRCRPRWYGGASYADLRVHAITTEIVQMRDGELESAVLDRDIGLAVRVIVDGTWGFASHAGLTPDIAAESARHAVGWRSRWRRSTPSASNQPTSRSIPTPPGSRTTASTPSTFRPLRRSRCSRSTRPVAVLRRVDHVSAMVNTVKEQTFYADTFGSAITQQRVRTMPSLEAVAVDAAAGSFESMRPGPAERPRLGGRRRRRGVELSTELAELPVLLAEKTKSPSVVAGPTDLVIDPTNLWLTIHESIGHATEYDRAIGYEAAYAGTSFATPDKLNRMQYGSPVMNVTADRTVDHGLATIGYDAEGGRPEMGSGARRVFVGYQLDRVFARKLGLERSNGCSYADSAHHVPIQRMPNVSLQPGADNLSTVDLISRVDNGIYIVGDKSWSIDMQRYNFQFTGQRFFRIRDGRLYGRCVTSPTRPPPPTSGTRWRPSAGPRRGGSAGRSTAARPNRARWPPSVTAVRRHLFRGVNVLNTVEESGR